MSKIAYTAAGFGAIFIVWGLASFRHTSPRADLSLINLNKRLDNAFEDIEFYTTVPPKQPRLVQTIRILPDPIEPPAIPIENPPLPVENPLMKVEHPKRNVEHDICTVHRLRKVYVSKYRWRCLK